MRCKVSDSGRITIPERLRDRFGIRTGDQIEFSETYGRLIMKKAVPDDPVSLVYGILDPGRSTDELIEELRGPVDIP